MSKQQYVGLYVVGKVIEQMPPVPNHEMDDAALAVSALTTPIFLGKLGSTGTAHSVIMRRLPLQQLVKAKPGIYVGVVTLEDGCMTTNTVPVRLANDAVVKDLILPELLAECVAGIEKLFGMLAVEGEAEASPEYVNQDHS